MEGMAVPTELIGIGVLVGVFVGELVGVIEGIAVPTELMGVGVFWVTQIM